MSENNKKPGDTKEKMEQHKKSTETSKEKKASTDSKQNIQKTGKGSDDWNDPTGNSHLSDK